MLPSEHRAFVIKLDDLPSHYYVAKLRSLDDHRLTVKVRGLGKSWKFDHTDRTLTKITHWHYTAKKVFERLQSCGVPYEVLETDPV